MASPPAQVIIKLYESYTGAINTIYNNISCDVYVTWYTTRVLEIEMNNNRRHWRKMVRLILIIRQRPRGDFNYTWTYEKNLDRFYQRHYRAHFIGSTNFRNYENTHTFITLHIVISNIIQHNFYYQYILPSNI